MSDVAVTHTLLLKCAEDRSGDPAMALALAGNLAARRAWRGLASPTTYIYLELITPVAMNAADRIASEATRRMSSDLTVDRLELHCDLTGASAASRAVPLCRRNRCGSGIVGRAHALV
jgi:hypothetical protein